MKRPILIIGAVAVLGFGVDAARAQSDAPIWAEFEPGDQPIPAFQVAEAAEPTQAVQLNLAQPNACDAHLGDRTDDEACRRQVNDFKAGKQARDARGEQIAFNAADDEQDGVRLDGLKLKAYHRF